MARPPLRVPQASVAGPDFKAEIEMIRRGQHAQAETRLATLRRQFPAHARVAALHGDALRGLEQYQEAITAYQTAMENGLAGTEVQLNLASCLVNNKQFQEALEAADTALSKKPDHAGALGLKSAAHRGLNQPQLARQAGRRALALNPRDASLLEAMAHLDTFAPHSPVFEIIPRTLEQTDLPPQKQAQKWATLGKAWLDVGEPAKAFEHYQRANDIMDGHLPPIKSELERLLTFTRHHFTPALFDALSPSGLSGRPQIIVAGMSRSGKSLVESLFRGVAGIRLAGEDPVLGEYRDELLQTHDRNMGQWLTLQTPDSIAEQAIEYARRLQALSQSEDDDDAIWVTTMPGDLWNLGLIGLWAPEVPIIFTVRNVLDLGVTGYFQQYEFPEGYRYSYNLHHMGRQIACFEKVMEHWAQVLPNPVYLVDYEALVADPQAIMNNLLGDLGLQREQAYDDIVGENAGMADAISPIVSMDAPMPIVNQFAGFAQPFHDQLEPLIQGYHTIVDEFPRLEPPATLPVALPDMLVDTDSDAPNPSESVTFDWQLEGQIMVVDQGGSMLKWPQIKHLMELGSFGLVSFDPAGDAANKAGVLPDENFQHIPQALLGEGTATTLHVCLDEAYSSTLPPLPGEQLPARLQQKAMALARLPLPTHQLDAIQGLERLDWLVLDERHDSLAVLEHGSRALRTALLIQVGLVFTPIYERQTSLAEILHWAARHGFEFHRLVNMQHQQAMTPRDDLPHQPEGTALERAAALLLPDADRLAAMDDAQRLKLAFVLDTVYGLHDVVYTLLQQVGDELAQNYLKARGYFDRHRGGPAGDTLTAIRTGLRQGELATQAEAIRHLAATHGRDAQVIRLQAELALWQGRSGHAIPLIKTALDQAPDDLGIRLSAIEILLDAGLWWEAHQDAMQLLEKQPDHVQVQAMAARTLAAQPSPDEDEASQALARLDNRTAAHPDDSPALWLSIRARLLARLERNDEALALHGQAITAATEAHPWARARAHYLHALTLHKLGQPDAACDALWQAAAIMPTSPVTALAQRQQTLWLAPADSADTGLESLHTDIARLRSKHHDSLPTGTYGLLPQGLDAIRLAGLRPTEVRLEAYGLQDWLPANAHALDATANQGLLLLGLADQLAKGTGLDERAFNQALFTAVAKYLDIRHVELLEQSFASFPHKQRFDLILACGLHSSQELTAAEIGQKCYQLTRPGGLVLLESRGTGSSEQIEAGFTSKVDDIAARGFDTVHSGYLCDDKRNRRMFVLLRRQ